MNNTATASKMDDYFRDYDAFHRHPSNKITHYFGIPMIVFSILGFLSAAGASMLTPYGLIFLALVLVFYVRIQPLWGTAFTALVAALFYVAAFVAWPIHLVLFVVGWILQGIGHYKYEKKSPAFLQNITHLMIGPFWIFRKLFKTT